jgi:hypothetical protein
VGAHRPKKNVDFEWEHCIADLMTECLPSHTEENIYEPIHVNGEETILINTSDVYEPYVDIREWL